MQKFSFPNLLFSKQLFRIAAFFFLSFSSTLFAQPRLFTAEWDNQSGTAGSKDYSTGWTFEAAAFGNYKLVTSVPSTGDAFFRFRNNANTTDRQPSGADGTIVPTNQTTAFTAIQDGNSKAFRVQNATTGYRYVFKVDAAINNLAIFEIQGTSIETVTSVTRSPSGTIYPGLDVTITANLSADFTTGQAAYLRYTNDGFATSTVLKMTGSGTSRTAVIPGTDNIPSATLQYYVFTSGDVASIAPADADLFTINADNNGGSNYSYAIPAGWIVDVTGSWSNGATWVGGNVPPTNANMGSITFDATNSTLTLNQDAIISSINIATGKVFVGSDGSPRTLTIVGGGAFTRVGTFTQTTNNTTVFANGGSISALTTWQNLHVGGGTLTPVGVQTIVGNFQINNGGSISTSATYTATSALVYNTGGSYNVGNEWTLGTVGAAAAGRPNDVIINSGTTLNLPTTNRLLARDITIESGATLNLNVTSGDILVQRNWINNGGTFNPNNRAVQFVGTSISSTITNASGETFAYLILNKTTSGNLTLNNNVTVNGSSGDVLQMLGAATNATTYGVINLNGNNLTLSGAGGNIFLGTHTAVITRNIIGTGNVFITGAKTVTRTSNATLVTATTVNVVYSAELNCGTGNLLTINGVLEVNAGGFVTANAPRYAATSTLIYNTGGAYGINTEWTATADAVAGVGIPQNVTIQSGTVNLPINFKAMAGNLTIASGSTFNLNATAGDFSLRGNWVNNGGTFNHNNRFVAIRGAANTTIGKISGGPEVFHELIIQKSATAFSTTLTSDVTIVGGSTFALQLITVGVASTLNLDTYTLTLNGTGNINIGTATASTIRTITGTGSLVIGGSAKTVTRNALANGLLTLGGTALTVLPNAGLNFGAGLTTLNGILQLNSGGTVVTNPPLYGAASTLIYNQGVAVSVASEWTVATLTAPPLAGRPANITITNNTDLTLPNVARSMYRNLEVVTGSLTLAAGATALSVGGNWTRQPGTTFTSNGRPVTFWSVAPVLATTINVDGGETFDAVTLAKTAGIYVNLASNVVINGVLTVTTGRLNIAANTLTLNSNVSTVVTNGTISGNSNSNLIVNGSAAAATLIFTTAVAENRLGSLTINRTGPGTVVLGSNLVIDNNSGLNDSQLNLTNGWLTVNAGFTLTVANTNIAGSTTSFVHTITTGRMAYLVSGAGTNTLTFPIGSAANINSYRPLSVSNINQTATNTYSAGSLTGTAASLSATFNSPLLGGSTVRYYPFNFGTIGLVSSVGLASLSVGADDNPSGLDNQTIIQLFGGSWTDIGATGGVVKTSTSSPDLSAAATTFAFGFTTFSTVFVSLAIGNDAFTGQNAANSPAGTGPKLTFNAAMSVVTNGGTISYVGNPFPAQTWDIDKNINTFQSATSSLANVTINVTAKAVMPFTPSDVNLGTDRITISAHQLVTGMAVRYNNYGEAFGFMPSSITPGTDILTVGGNIPTGQPVVYQAYPSTGAAGGLTHGTTYYAINVTATTIRLAATYADALANTEIDITSTGSAESHGVIVSESEGLVSGTIYYAIVIDANTIALAASNPDAIAGISIDLRTVGGGNHVLVFTPSVSIPSTGRASLNINDVQSNINAYINLTNANPTINLTAGTFFMQPTFNLTKTMILNGAGIGNTILDGGGKISSATTYFGVSYPTIALAACTLRNLSITRYYNGINRNSTLANTSNVIEAVESSDNFCRGLNWEGSGAIATALTIRNSTFSNNNGVGVNSTGIYINGMAKAGLNIRNNTCIGNRKSGIEIGPTGVNTNFFIRGNTIAGVNAVSPLQNSVTEFGIVVSDASPTGTNTHIADNDISMYGRAGIECRGCVGNTAVSGNGSFRIASNLITQLGGPFRVEPNTALQNDNRDVAGIAVGSMEGSALSSGVAVDTNQIVGLQQPFSATSAFTAFGIVSAGDNIVLRANIVTGCEIGIQAQQGSTGNENNTPDNYYSRDNTATTTNYLANRNSILSNTVFGVRNEVGGTLNFLGNWWGDPTGPSHAGNTSPAGLGELVPAGTTIAYNAYLAEEPDDNIGTGLGQRGIQVLGPKKFRLKPTTNAQSLAVPHVLNQGISVGFGTPTTGFTDTLDVYSYPTTYTMTTESVRFTKPIYMRGNFGNSPRVILTGTGNSIHPVEQSPNARMLVNIAARNAGIENFNVRVNVPGFVLGPSNLIGISDTVASSATVINGLRIRNNFIENTGSSLFPSFGIYLKSSSQQSEASTVNIENNIVDGDGGNYGWGRGIRAWGCGGTISGNTLVGVYGIQWGNPASVTGITNYSNNTFIGGVELNSPGNNATVNISGNSFQSNTSSGSGYTMSLELRYQQYAATTVNIENNDFEDIAATPTGFGFNYPYYGILSLRSRNVNILNNNFTAHPSAQVFNYIHVSTRQQGTSSTPPVFDNSVTIKGNTFSGNGQTTPGRTAVTLARHRGTQTFSSVVMGGPTTEANTFDSNLSRFIELDPYSGAFASAPFPYQPILSFGSDGVNPIPLSVPFNVNFDAFENVFGVSGGNKLPAAMTKAELIELEDKVQHAIDFADLGFVTLKANTAIVTSNSFLPGYTAVKLYNRATPHVSDGWTILSQAGIFSESITAANDLTFQSTGTTTLQNLTINGTGKTLTIEDNHNVTNVVTLTDGIIETEPTSELFVENTAAAAVVGGSNTAHINGNLRRAIATGILYDFPVGNGTVEELLSMNFASVSGLNDVVVSFTNTAPGTNFDNFNEFNAQFTQILQSGYWIVEPNSGGTSNNYEMRLKPVNFTDFPVGKAAYSIVKRVGAGNWGKDGTISNPDPLNLNNGVWIDGTLRRTGLNGFSNFGVGASPLVPLPLSLVSFAAQLRSGRAVVTWQVVKEDENTTYVVEKSLNGVDFQLIGTISGEAKAVGYYEFTDPTWVPSEAQRAYYRLRILEEGKTSLSQIEQLSIRNQPQPQIWPNPAKDVVFVRLGEASTVRMVNVTGKVVMNEQVGRGVQTIPVSHLPAGFYHVEVKSEQGIDRYNFQKD